MNSVMEWVGFAILVWLVVLFIFTGVDIGTRKAIWGKQEYTQLFIMIGLFIVFLMVASMKDTGWTFGIKELGVLAILAIESVVTHLVMSRSNRKEYSKNQEELKGSEPAEEEEPARSMMSNIYIWLEPLSQRIAVPRGISLEEVIKIANSNKKLEDGELKLVSTEEQLKERQYVFVYTNKEIRTVTKP